MYPHERSLVKQLAGKPFALIGVNSDRDLDALKPVLEEQNITWRSFWNGPQGTGGPISKKWNVSGWPTIYVIDAEGKIRYKNSRGNQLDRALETLLAEAGHEVELKDHEEHGQAKAEDGDSESGAEPEAESDPGKEEPAKADAGKDADAE